ncbi:hypothetical protein GGR58DRAFT_185488 [Xylaria digitata]|nr:hypothetical protein GGR58DRAFT_185488 [Xylaria digitata]
MATEQQQPAITVLAPPREPQQSLPLGESGGAGPSQPVEFRGFDFFAQRDFNEYKNASQAYFAEKNGNPSSWLGDATPPASAHPSLDEPRPEGSPRPSSEGEPNDEKKILGLRRPWFWTLLAISAVVIIVAIGLGVGIGLTQRSNGSKSASANAIDPASDANNTGETSTDTLVTTGMATATSSPSPTLTRVSTTSTRTPVPTSVLNMSCPDINGTVYNVPGSTKKFLRLCGIDYGKEDGAVDIRNVYTDSAEDCIDNCAGTTGCTGCGWGFIEGDKGPPYRCWLKRNVNGKSHNADMTWYFATLI